MVNFGHVSELLKKNRARCYQVVCSDINQYRRKKRGFKRKNKGLYGKLGKWETPQKSRCRDDENIENKTVAYILVLKKNEQYFLRALHKFPFLENVSSIKPFWKITNFADIIIVKVPPNSCVSINNITDIISTIQRVTIIHSQ